ncbi:MAG: hypothetical protein GY782_10215 [Gammaproteobacteria bacterium]|nr:hypothetical protein [Gammaproteobacteria bacterium]
MKKIILRTTIAALAITLGALTTACTYNAPPPPHTGKVIIIKPNPPPPHNGKVIIIKPNHY